MTRPPTQLLHSRARVRPRYALFPIEGYPPSKLPHWTGAEARVLASPALGAQFVQYLIHLQPQGGTFCQEDHRTEAFLYVLSGNLTLLLDEKHKHALHEGGFAFVPHTTSYRIESDHSSTILLLKKVFEPAADVPHPPAVVSNQADVEAAVYQGDEGARLQTLLPDDVRFDLAMNIFTFQPGRSLPVVETHVMEHGLYFLQGRGVYYLDHEWMEVEASDFIWMGPYVPQSFYATGPTPSKYIYYKNVNRDIPL